MARTPAPSARLRRGIALRLAGIACILAIGGGARAAESFLPSFQARALSGEKVSEQQLLGETTILIVTPSRHSAEETRQWARTLREDVATKERRVRDVLCIDLPFFMSEQDALGRARERIPEAYHQLTWLLDEAVLEEALSVPRNSEDAFVFVLDPEGRVAARVQGSPSPERVAELKAVLDSLP